MQLLFTTNPDALFSRLILEITKEPVSHVALQMGPWVLHSNYRGVHAETLYSFKKHNQIKLVVPIWGITTDTVLKRFSDREFKPYDLLGVLSFGVHLLARRYLPGIPKVQLMQASGMDFCVELVQHLIGSSHQLITPYQLYCQLTD